MEYLLVQAHLTISNDWNLLTSCFFPKIIPGQQRRTSVSCQSGTFTYRMLFLSPRQWGGRWKTQKRKENASRWNGIFCTINAINPEVHPTGHYGMRTR